MSAGIFERSKYELDNGGIASCRVQPETLSATFGTTQNLPPAGDVDQPGSVRMRQSRRQFGVYVRRVTVAFTSTIPAGYRGEPLVLPIMRQSLFDSLNIGSEGVYLGQEIEVIAKSSESVR